MNAPQIIARRLSAQGLVGPPFKGIVDVVRTLGAVQAQDYAGAKWAIGQRCGSTDADLDKAFNAGTLLRTHMMRPTWHFVLPEDIRWMLMLTAPRVQRFNAYMYRKLGLTERILKRGDEVIARALESGPLERTEIERALNAARIKTGPNQLVHLLMHAELEQHICSGPRVGKQFTYALLSAQAPKARILGVDEALAELARRYFGTRGPANLADFAWWSGRTVSDGKKAVALIEHELLHVQINGVPCWYAEDAEVHPVPKNSVHLLPNYDECAIGLKDRSAFSDPKAVRAADTPAWRHFFLVDGRGAGMWEYTLTKGVVEVRLAHFRKPTTTVNTALRKAVERFGNFLGVQARLQD